MNYLTWIYATVCFDFCFVCETVNSNKKKQLNRLLRGQRKAFASPSVAVACWCMIILSVTCVNQVFETSKGYFRFWFDFCYGSFLSVKKYWERFQCDICNTKKYEYCASLVKILYCVTILRLLFTVNNFVQHVNYG